MCFEIVCRERKVEHRGKRRSPAAFDGALQGHRHAFYISLDRLQFSHVPVGGKGSFPIGKRQTEELAGHVAGFPVKTDMPPAPVFGSRDFYRRNDTVSDLDMFHVRIHGQHIRYRRVFSFPGHPGGTVFIIHVQDQVAFFFVARGTGPQQRILFKGHLGIDLVQADFLTVGYQIQLAVFYFDQAPETGGVIRLFRFFPHFLCIFLARKLQQV